MESVEFLGRYRLTQSDACFKLGRDSVLLARFCTLRPRWSVCDLGCGVGSLLLLLSQREEALDRVGVELDPVAAGLAALRGARLEPKRLQLLSYGPSSPPYAVLVEAVKEGGPGLEILPVHYQTESAH